MLGDMNPICHDGQLINGKELIPSDRNGAADSRISWVQGQTNRGLESVRYHFGSPKVGRDEGPNEVANQIRSSFVVQDFHT